MPFSGVLHYYFIAVNKMGATSWRFRSDCKENAYVDSVLTDEWFILKQVDYSLSISLRDS